MSEKPQNADSGKEIKEKNKKKINKKEKTTQQQKGPPTLSTDLNYSHYFDHIFLGPQSDELFTFLHDNTKIIVSRKWFKSQQNCLEVDIAFLHLKKLILNQNSVIDLSFYAFSLSNFTSSMSWLISFAWANSSCKDRKPRITK